MKISFKSQKGEMETLILIVIVVAAFVFVGGQSAFDMIYPDEDATPTPTPTQGSLNSKSDWSVEYIATTCDEVNQISNVSVGLHGSQAGYYTISVNGAIKSTQTFTPNSQNLMSIQLPLPNSMEFNTKQWVIELFSGGSNGSGGTSQVSKTMNPTNCQ